MNWKMVLRGCLFIGLFITVGCLTKCYHKKCKTSQYRYTDCDQEYYRCDEYDDFWEESGSCQYQGHASFGGYEYCYSSQRCSTDYYTGQAECIDDDSTDTDDWEDDWDDAWDKYESGIGTAVTIIIVVVCVTFGMIFMCCLCCFCLGKGCFKNRSQNQGRVINAQPVTYNQPTGAVQTTAQPQGSKQPATQYPPAKYPPAQYPPAQYPPAQYPPGQYPPTQYPPGQYPPTQYPPGQYPPAQYPPAGGYPPAENPPAGGYPAAENPPPAVGPPPPTEGSSDPPPSYQSSVQPAENPYVEAFRS